MIEGVCFIIVKMAAAAASSQDSVASAKEKKESVESQDSFEENAISRSPSISSLRFDSWPELLVSRNRPAVRKYKNGE